MEWLANLQSYTLITTGLYASHLQKLENQAVLQKLAKNIYICSARSRYYVTLCIIYAVKWAYSKAEVEACFNTLWAPRTFIIITLEEAG